MKFFFYILFIHILLFASCNENTNSSRVNFTLPKVIEANSYVVPMDSMEAPIVVQAGKPRIVKVGKPIIVPTNTNVVIAGKPSIIIAGKPNVCTPGKNGFLLPTIVPAIDSPFIAGIPKVVVAKDGASKDINPSNFSFFKIQQGLSDNDIRSLIQDKEGNIWIGTNSKGVICYNGATFKMYTTKEGLLNNMVTSLFEDKKGNIWIGTLRGVSCFNGKEMTNYSSEQGLLSHFVSQIFEDKKGNLWFCNYYDGISCYDGKNFKIYTDKQGLCHNAVLSGIIDHKGNFWFATYGGGISCFDGEKFINYSKAQGLSTDDILSIYEDRKGNIWCGTLEGGIICFDGKRFKTYKTEQGLSDNSVWCIKEDYKNNLWFATEDGISCYDGLTFTNYSKQQGLSHGFVFCILEDKSKNLWFGTRIGGINLYNKQNFKNYTKQEGLSDNTIYSILEDTLKNLWFGAGDGLIKYDRNFFSIYNNFQGLSNISAICLFQDNKKNIWFGTNGQGICCFNGKEIKNYTKLQGLSNDIVLCMIQDKLGVIWIGTYGGGVCRFDGKTFTAYTSKQGLVYDNILCMLEDKKGNLWFGSEGGGISCYNNGSFINYGNYYEKQETSNFISSISEDASGNLWLGTLGEGIYKYDKKKFINYTEDQGLANNNVVGLLTDKGGNVWCGTNNGLSKIKLNKQNNFNDKQLFYNYGKEDGLNISIYNRRSIFQDSKGIIWIGADKLMSYDQTLDIPDTIAPDLQLTGIELFNDNIPWLTLEKKKDSTLILSNGVKLCDYSFDSVSKWYHLPHNLSLVYDNNYITFNFIGITTKYPKKVKYQYKLEGLEHNWSVITDKTYASYGNLPNGKYTFTVKAMNSEGYWSNEFDYSFTIRPPWYKTWWFIALSIVLIIGSVIVIFKYRTTSLLKRQKELEHTVDKRTEEVVFQKEDVERKKNLIEEQKRNIELYLQQVEQMKKNLETDLNYYMQLELRKLMNPHFIFNSLNSIQSYILENDQLAASLYLSRFSELIRSVLDDSQQKFITLSKELKTLSLYIELEQKRFEDKFNYTVVIDSSLDMDSFYIPPLILQPIVENAIWHGMMHSGRKGFLTISFKKEETCVVIDVEDNGIGREESMKLNAGKLHHKSVGINITSKRIDLINSIDNTTMHIKYIDKKMDSHKSLGTIVEIRIPLTT